MLTAQIRSWPRRFDAAVGHTAGTQLVSLPVFLVGLFASTLLRILGTPLSRDTSLWEQVLDGWLAFLLFWLWMQLATRGLLRFGSPARYWVVASVLVGAAGRGALVHFLINEHQQEPIKLLGYRMLSSLLLVGFLMLLTSYVLDVMRRQTARLDQLVVYRKALAEALEKSSVELESWFAELSGEIKSRLLRQLGEPADIAPGTFSSRLKALITDVLRPISSELAKATPPNPEIKEPQLSEKQNLVRMAQAAATARWRLLSVTTPFVIGVISIPSVYVFGNASAPEVFAGFALLQWAGLSVANFIFEKRPQQWSVLRGAVLLQSLTLLANLLPAYYTVWSLGFLQERPNSFHTLALTLTVGFSLVTLLISTVNATLRGARQIESDLQDTVTDLRWHLAKTKGEMWRRQQALARALHGPLQAILTSNSIRLDLEETTTKRDALEATAIDETYRAIRSIDDLALESPNIERDLEAIIERWRGICDVRLEKTDDAIASLASDPTAARIVLDLLQDALSNSIRHGAASQAVIEIHLKESNLLRAVVTDNGSGLAPDFGSGVGSYQLDLLTTDWSLTNLDDGAPGARLEFSLPVSTSGVQSAQFTDLSFLS